MSRFEVQRSVGRYFVTTLIDWVSENFYPPPGVVPDQNDKDTAVNGLESFDRQAKADTAEMFGKEPALLILDWKRSGSYECSSTLPDIWI
jgi:hypothetical protein